MAAERSPNDFYRTPSWAIERFLCAWSPTIPAPKLILEPAAAGRALLPPLRATWPAATICPRDLVLQPGDEGVVEQRNFWLDDEPEQFDLVITNPPYEIAETFVRAGLMKLRQGGRLALLLRLGFLASRERKPLFTAHVPESVWVLTERPSFGTGPTAGKTDFSEYAWMVWQRGQRRKHAELRWL